METEDIVTLIPRFVITPGTPPVRDVSQRGPSRERNEAPADAASSASDDVGDTLLPADVEPYAPARPLPARSMLRRLPAKAS